MPVFNPSDIERIRGETVELKPFPVEGTKEEKSLARVPSQDGVKVLAQMFADRFSSSGSVPVEKKVFLNLNEASEYSGMPKAWLRRQIKSEELKAKLAGGWRIRRVDLENL